jgi:pyrimidine operon attenuation protein / uracil phosphoribosyltransferase
MTVILNSDALHRALTRMAHEIIEQNGTVDQLVLIGLQTRGVFISRRLAQLIHGITGREVALGSLDISLYRDDLNLRVSSPNLKHTDIPISLDEKVVVLVDDVLFTGRTVRAAMDALNDFGRPRCIQLAILIDRGHRELPIRADYVGKNVPTSKQERIQVRMKEEDGSDEVGIEKRSQSGGGR